MASAVVNLAAMVCPDGSNCGLSLLMSQPSLQPPRTASEVVIAGALTADSGHRSTPVAMSRRCMAHLPFHFSGASTHAAGGRGNLAESYRRLITGRWQRAIARHRGELSRVTCVPTPNYVRHQRGTACRIDAPRTAAYTLHLSSGAHGGRPSRERRRPQARMKCRRPGPAARRAGRKLRLSVADQTGAARRSILIRERRPRSADGRQRHLCPARRLHCRRPRRTVPIWQAAAADAVGRQLGGGRSPRYAHVQWLPAVPESHGRRPIHGTTTSRHRCQPPTTDVIRRQPTSVDMSGHQFTSADISVRVYLETSVKISRHQK